MNLEALVAAALVKELPTIGDECWVCLDGRQIEFEVVPERREGKRKAYWKSLVDAV